MNFTDRRPTSGRARRQPEQQLSLPGMERPASASEAVSPHERVFGSLEGPSGGGPTRWAAREELPVGRRGSISERLALPGRYRRGEQNRHGVMGSHRMRAEDQGMDGYDREDYPDAFHERTGLPKYGEIPTSELGFAARGHPKALGFHSSAPSARRAVGKITEVPIVHMGTSQGEVSAQRLHSVLEDPSTRSSPRFHGKGLEQLPFVYHDRRKDEYSTIDGNHRLSAAKLEGQMFQPARVLTDKDVPAVQSRTRTVDRMKKAASQNPRAQSEEDQERKLFSHYYPSDYA